MCLAAILIGQHARFPWVIASNRDEFFDRPAAPLSWWRPSADAPAILGGKDLSAGGAWLGINEAGKLALLTNVREPGRFDPKAASRGDLVPQWLLNPRTDQSSLETLVAPSRNGFNLLAADLHDASAIWLTNRPPQHQRIDAGVYGLSNAALDTPWPKVSQLKKQILHSLLSATAVDKLADEAFVALSDRRLAPNNELPSTGVPLERERQLSAAFIRIRAADSTSGVENGVVYGTRCSTVVIAERIEEIEAQEAKASTEAKLKVHVFERRFDEAGEITGQTNILL